MNSDRQHILDALQEHVRILSKRLRDELSVSSLFKVWNVQYARGEMGSGKIAGEDGIPAEWHKAIGARVTTTVHEEERDRDSTPMEVLYPSALAHLISDTYTQIHKDGVAPTGMRTSIISFLYKEKGGRSNLWNYRPIAVGNTVAKILEKCMEIRIRP